MRGWLSTVQPLWLLKPSTMLGGAKVPSPLLRATH
jgi:hypothetical protein